jgi:hypothetical protein
LVKHPHFVGHFLAQHVKVFFVGGRYKHGIAIGAQAVAQPFEALAKRTLITSHVTSGSLDGIRQATIEELAAVPGMTRKQAAEIKERL